MIDRLRFLLDRPLDPLAARAVVVLATAVLLGFAAVFVLGTSQPGPSAAPREQGLPARPQSGQPLGRAPLDASPPLQAPPSRRRQDPQDEKGSAAAKRAARALNSHRALQHVPYRRGELSIELVGVRGGRAALRVSAPTLAEARGGWRRFLRRYGDAGRAYAPRFKGGVGARDLRSSG
jgi:hypothetical protein